MQYNRELNYEELSKCLIETVRCEADLEYSKCQDIVIILLRQIKDFLPSNELDNLATTLSKDLLDVETCPDTQRVNRCLDCLSSCRMDSQERSWSLHEDAETILEELTLLQRLVRKADKRVSLFCLSLGNYQRLIDLVEFYQMETRLVVRISMLDTIKALLLLDPLIISILLPTVFSVELIRDLSDDRQITDLKKLLLSTELLTILFCTGEAVPFCHYDVLNTDFTSLLVNVIEGETTQKLLPNLDVIFSCLKALVALNLHFTHPKDSPVIASLETRSAAGLPCKQFTEHLLILANRQEDPIWPFTKQNATRHPNSLIKFLQDIFYSECIPALFYSNDRPVLVEIVVRGVCDLPFGKLRSEYLALLDLILKNSKWEFANLGEIRNAIEMVEISLQSEDLSAAVDCVDRHIIESIRKSQSF